MKSLGNSKNAYALVLLVLISKASWGNDIYDGWTITSEDVYGNNLTKVCLAQQESTWIEKDPNNPDNCEEMLIVERDRKTIGPDKRFYSRKHGLVSRIFKVKDTYNLGYLFQWTPSVIVALKSSGALERLDKELAQGVKNPEQIECEKSFESAQTLDQLHVLESRCRGYPEDRKAYQRITDADDAAKEKKREAAAAKNQPKCFQIRFSGIAVGDPISLEINSASNADDILARQPLSCWPSGITQLYACSGGARFYSQIGYVIAWTDYDYEIATPVDLQIGRKDAMLYISRKDAVCENNIRPSLNFSENWKNFLRNYNENR